MANKLASELLKQLSESNGSEKGVTTTLDAESMAIVEKWRRNGKSVKATVRSLLEVANESLEEAKRGSVEQK